MDQEKIMQIQMMEQEANQLNEQMQVIDQNIKEMNQLKESLDEIEKGETEILTNIGKKIYLPVKITDKNLIVEVGKGNYVKKSVEETLGIINQQTERLTAGKSEVMSRLNQLQQEMQNLIIEFEQAHQKEQQDNSKKD